MATGRDLGKAYVSIVPDTEKFKPELQKALKDAVAGTKASVNVGADTKSLTDSVKKASKEVNKDLEKLRDEAKAILKDGLKFYIDADDTKGKAKIDKIRASLTELANMSVEVKPDVADTAVAKTTAKLSGLKSQLEEFGREEVHANADVFTAPAQKNLDELIAKFGVFGRLRATAHADVDVSRARRALSSIFGDGGYFDKAAATAEEKGKESGGAWAGGFGTGLPKAALIPIVIAALGALPAAVGVVGAATGVALGAGIIALAVSEIKKNAKQLNTALKKVAADQRALATAENKGTSQNSILAKQASDAVLANSIKQLQAQGKLTAAQKTTLSNDKIKLAYGQQQLANLQSQGSTSRKNNAAAVQAAKDKLKADQQTVQALQQQQQQLARFQKIYVDLKAQANVIKESLFGAVADSGFLKSADDAVQKFGGEVQSLRGPLQRLFAESAPYIQPFVNTLTGLVRNILPGLNTMLKQARGPLTQFIGSLGTIVGTQLSSWFEAAIPFIQKSSNFVETLVKTLGTLGTVLIDVGGAVAAVLGPALGAVNNILQALLPAFKQLALSISGTLGPAIAGLASSLGRQITPVLIQFIHGLTAVVPIIAEVVKAVTSLATAMPWLSGSILAVWGSFKIWGGVSALVGRAQNAIIGFASSLKTVGEKSLPVVSKAASGLSSILGGLPLGAVGLAAGGLAAIIGVGLYAAMSNSKTAAQKLDDQLQHNIDTAKDLGAKYAAAQRLVSVTTQQYADAQRKLADAQRSVANGSGAANQAARTGIGVSQQAAAAVNTQGAALRNARNELANLNEQLRRNTGLSPGLVHATENESDKLNKQLQAANALTSAWDRLNGISQDYSQNAQSLQSAIQTLTNDMKTQGISANQLWGDQNQLVSSLQQMVDSNQSAMAAAQGNTGAQKILRKALADQIAAALNSVPANSAAAEQIRAMGAKALGTTDDTKALRKAIRDAGGQASSYTSDAQKAAGATANLGVKGTDAHGKFVKLASQLGIAKGKTEDLWRSLQKLPATKRIQVLESISGKGALAITASGYAPGVGQKNGQVLIPKSASLLGVGRASGGMITGPGTGTSDSIPARLSNGEYVVKADAVKKVGVQHLDAINSGNIPGFATGGVVAMNNSVIPKTVSTSEDAIKAVTQALMKKVQQAFASSVSYNASAGVKQWLPDVLKALALNGLPGSLANQVLKQISSESGGNPNAQNNWDSNAAAGDPSRGLLQTIMSTFRAYHVAGTSNNIFDPLANIAAAINYAKHVYGPSLMRGGMGLGSGHGYKFGGLLHEKVVGLGTKSGQPYAFSAGESVKPSRKVENAIDQTAITNQKLDALVAEMRELRKATNHVIRNTGDTSAAVSGKSLALRRF